MTSSQQNATRRLPLSNNIASSWGTKNAILADNQLLDTVGCTDLGDQLDDFRVVESAITANDEGSALCALRDGEQDACDE